VLGCELRSFDHVELRDVKINRQWLYIQDPLEDLTDGGQPSFLKCEAVEDLCGKVIAGDRVIANGQYRSIPIRKGGVLTTSKDVYFDVSSLEINEREFEEVNLTEQDEKMIIELSKSEHLFEKLTDSVAPSILGMRLLKKAIILQLFEGVTRKLKDGVVNRGHINVLCVSDPGMAKTKLLRFVASIAPRGVFTNATTSTKVGLVAPIVRDETTGEYTVQAGAYMIASGGILCLDEVSELDKGEFKYLNEAMEDGEAHITKGGLNITVKTRASLLAACNPIEGSFDSYQPLAEQVKIPESTLSRFDLKILLQDISEEGKDRKMIEHITSTHMDEFDRTDFITPEVLRKYIAFGRKIKPKLNVKSKKIVDDYYVSIRKECSTDKMKVTPRQGTAVIRLAEAHARMRLSDEVSEEDAKTAVELFDMCFRNVATDPITGRLDVSRTEVRGKGIADALIRVIRNGTDGKVSETEILSEMNKLKYESERVLHTLRLLKNEGKVIEPKNGIYKVM
jgi:replicative DNA helicase Mcm